MAFDVKPLDVLTIGEMVVDFISAEKTDTLSNASTFRRYLGGSPANIAVYVTGARDTFWSAMLMAHLDGKGWPEAVRFAHEVASLKLGVEGHVERMIDREEIYTRLRTTAGQP